MVYNMSLSIQIQPIGLYNLECAMHTDRSESQLYRVFTKNYFNAPRVPMGIWGSVYDPRT